MNTSFIYRRLLPALFLFLILGAGNARAAKYAAAEIYADYVGNGPKDLRYRVTLIVYHACSEGKPDLNIGPGATENICYAAAGCLANPAHQNIKFRYCDTLPTFCPAAGNSCSNPSSTTPGYYRAVYSDTVDISVYGQCADWEFGWWSNTNYRNPAIKNLTLLIPTTTDVRCRINNTGNYYNTSSPRYLTPPIFTYCVNQHDIIPYGPYDPDGDSLYTVNMNPLRATDCLHASNILPEVGYGLYPIDGLSTDPYSVDGLTGTATITPTTTGVYDVAVETDKYDPYNHTLIGYCRRDVELYVQTCAATPPVMDTMPQSLLGATYDGPTHTISVCPGTLISFNLSANGPAGSIFTMVSDNAISAPGSNFFVTGYGTNSVLGGFSWKPTSKQIGLHTIVFTTTDSSCTGGEMAKTYYVMNIRVMPSVDAGPDLSYCGPGSIMPQLQVTGVPPDGTYAWSHPVPFGLGFADHLTDSVISNPFAFPDTSTTYVITYTTADGTPLACKNSDTVRVLVFPPEKHNGGPDQIICLNQTAILNPSFSKVDAFVWQPDPTLNNVTLRNPTVKPVKLGLNTYFIVITDVNNCEYNDSSHVITRDIAPNILALATPDTLCPGGTSQLLVNIEEQACGGGTGKCSGTAKDVNVDKDRKDIFVGTNNSSNPQDPTPYQQYYYTGGNRMQIIYTAKELYSAGLSAGYINSIAFDVAKKISINIDSFKGFTIKMACTTDGQFAASTSNPGSFLFGAYTFVTVYNAKVTGVSQGWNLYLLSTPYYWDGVSNLVVEICASTPKLNNTSYFTPNGDNMYLVPTDNVQTVFTWDNFTCCSSGLANGCSWPNNSPYNAGVSSRPVTQFNFCQSLSNYTIKWSPAAGLSNATTYNPVASNVGKTTKYWVQVSVDSSPGCVSIDTVYLTVDTSTMIAASAQDTVLCRPGYTYLNAEGRGKKPVSNLPCGIDHPQICSSPATVVIANGAAAAQIAGTDYTPFKNSSNKTQWIISNKILSNSGMTSGTIGEMDMQTWGSGFGGTTFKNVEIRIGCTPKSSFISPADTLSIRSMVLEYTAAVLTLPATGIISFPFTAPYNWDTTQNLVVQICYGDMTGAFPQVYTTSIPTSYNSMVQFYGFDAFYCQAFSNVPYTPVMYKHIPGVTFKYCPAPDGDFGYTWKPGMFLSDSSAQSPEVYVPNSVTYTVSTQGRNHCIVKDSVHIYVPVHHFGVNPKDTSICAGNTVQLHAKGATYYQWYQNGYKSATSLSCQTCASPIASPTDTTTYQVVATDSVFCSDTLFAKINVKPIPDVKIVTHDTTLDYGSNIQLAATGAQIFTWSPANTLSNPNIVNPIASPTEPVTYVVTGVAADGCSAQDTVRININYRGRLYVPSAFSPNKDGRNDRFRVANFTFEKILEFHVYNRWGQEVFTATDNKGWDGTWKNVPQDMDTYEYLVRVGFPDGFVETFKGDVTLVR